MSKLVELDGFNLKIDDVRNVARNGWNVSVTTDALANITASYTTLMELAASDAPLYGVNTGFGSFSNIKLAKEQMNQLSRNIVLSHACAFGEPLSDDIVRAAMLIRVNSFATGKSGVSVLAVNTLLDMLNKGVTPIVPSYGSLAASGDLCLLSHVVLCMCQPLGEEAEETYMAHYGGEVMPATTAMSKAGIPQIILGPKEGLAITNGATFTAGLLALNICDAFDLWRATNVALALSMEALMGVPAAYDERIHAARGVEGSMLVAKQVKALLSGSSLVSAKNRLQDSYTLRCAPQVQGPVHDNLLYAKEVVERELNASTDNPLLFGREVVSGGNFHGEVLGLQSDALKVNVCSLANISERRCAKLTTSDTSNGLPSMLVPEEAGLNSGLMIPPYSAASVTLRCHTLASPDTIRSLPTSGNQEDYNSNAWNSALFLKEIIDLAYRVVAIEIFCATRGINIRLSRSAHTLGTGTGRFYGDIMRLAPYSKKDYYMKNNIDNIAEYMGSAEFSKLYTEYVSEKGHKLNLQPPSGTRDFHPWQMVIREALINKIKKIFKSHGGQEIDTSILERRKTLVGQYGDNDKLIYELLDQGGVELALRYDLTVPFARYVAANNISEMKRVHIAKVYRRDNPSIVTGRYREFYQCDLDICGKSGKMIADAEILHTVWDVLTQVDVTPFVIKLNHRQLLTEILSYCGVPEEIHGVVCSSIDKLDKQSWESVYDEILLKGVTPEAAQLVGKYMTVKGAPREALERLRTLFNTVPPSIAEIIDDMQLLSTYLEKMHIDSKFELDMSLARGLSYYTGIIFEAVSIREMSVDGTPPARIGSIAAGGRYDNLIGMFCDRKVPAVGCSFGIERLFTFAEMKQGTIKQTPHIDVLVHAIGEECMGDAMEITSELWSLGTVSVQFRHASRIKMQEQIEFCLNGDVKYMIIVGQTEVETGTVNFKTFARDGSKAQQTIVKRSDLKEHVRKLLC